MMRRKQLVWILSVMTVLATFSKAVIGLDFDENYIMVLGARLLQGDHLFRECWDLYQTTGLTMTLVLGIYSAITGSYEGAILFCRVVTAILQLGLGFFVYRLLRRYYRNADFAGIFVANFLPRGTMNLEYGFLSCNYILVAMCLLLCYAKDSDTWNAGRRAGTVVIAGLCFSMGMLSYPTMIISVPVLIFYFIRKGRTKLSITCLVIFFSTCVACAGFFFTYVLSFISVQEMLDNIRNGILLDASHGNGNLLGSLFGSLMLSREKWVQIILLLGLSLIASVLYRWMRKQGIAILYHILLLSSLILILTNLSMLRPSGVYGFQIRYVMIVLSFAPLLYRIKDRELACLFYGMGFFMLLGTLLGSNLGIAENAAFLYLSLIAVIIGQGQESWEDRRTQQYAICAVLCLLLSVILVKGFVVRINGTHPANILTEREQMDFGPFAGIYLDLEQKEEYRYKKQTIDQFVREEDVMLIMSQDPVYNLMSEANFTSATALTTPVYGKQWVEYYRDRDYRKPTIILIDKAYFDLDTIINHTEFGEYIQQMMDMDTLIDAEGFWIVRR